MVKSGLLVRFAAAPGKELEVEKLVTGLLARVQKEAGTHVWLALRFSATSFRIFNGLADSTARNAHLVGELMSRLREAGARLFVESPRLEKVYALASKLPN